MAKTVFSKCPKCGRWFSNSKGKEIVGLSDSELREKQENLERRGLSCIFRKVPKHCPACEPSMDSQYPLEERRGQQVQDINGRGYHVR